MYLGTSNIKDSRQTPSLLACHTLAPLSLSETGKSTITLMLAEGSPATTPAPPFWPTGKQAPQSGLYISRCSLTGELDWVLVVWLSPTDFISSLILHYQMGHQLLNELPDHKCCLLSAVVSAVCNFYPTSLALYWRVGLSITCQKAWTYFTHISLCLPPRQKSSFLPPVLHQWPHSYNACKVIPYVPTCS